MRVAGLARLEPGVLLSPCFSRLGGRRFTHRSALPRARPREPDRLEGLAPAAPERIGGKRLKARQDFGRAPHGFASTGADGLRALLRTASAIRSSSAARIVSRSKSPP